MEIVVAMALSVMLLSALGGAMISMSANAVEAGSRMRLYTDMAASLRFIQDELRRAGYYQREDITAPLPFTWNSEQHGVSYSYQDGVEYLYGAIKLDSSKKRLGYCSVRLATPAANELTASTQCSPFYSLLDDKFIQVSNFTSEVSSTGEYALLTLSLTASLKKGGEPVTLTVLVSPRVDGS